MNTEETPHNWFTVIYAIEKDTGTRYQVAFYTNQTYNYQDLGLSIFAKYVGVPSRAVKLQYDFRVRTTSVLDVEFEVMTITTSILFNHSNCFHHLVPSLTEYLTEVVAILSHIKAHQNNT